MCFLGGVEGAGGVEGSRGEYEVDMMRVDLLLVLAEFVILVFVN